MQGTALQSLEADVRELIRRRRINPDRDDDQVHHLIGEVLDEYHEGVLLEGRVPLADRQEAHRLLLESVTGFGPLQPYLDDPAVEEIWINGPHKIFVARHGRSELTSTMLTERQMHDLVERMLRSSGRRVDLSNPFVDACLPDGSRLHVAIPDITRRHWAVNIRKFVVAADQLSDLVRLGTLTAAAATFLEAAVVSGLNILVAGGTQAGKTTLLNCLAAAIPAHERVVTCEEVFELRLGNRDVVAMQCRQPNLEGKGEVRLRRLVKEALRMRPDRIIIGEVREAESFDMLIAFNAGVPGLCTIHANSAREAVAKMCTLPLLAGENVSSTFVVPTVASAVDLVVHLELDRAGRRQVREIAAVTGRAEGGVVEVAEIFSRGEDGELHRRGGFPSGEQRFRRAGYDLATLLAPERES